MMSEPDQPPNGQSDGVDLSKSRADEGAPPSADPTADAPFDPYRFGKPEHPIPSEYAPPGYTGPTVPSTPASGYPGVPGPSGGYPGTPANPFANPPGTPYSPGPQPPYQGPPGSPYGYGAPPPPPYHGYPQPTTGNGKAVAALVLGIASIVLSWLLIFDAVFVILGLIFGLIALGESRSGRAGGRGLAVAGLVCTVVGALLATLLTVLIFRAADRCGGFSNDTSSDFQHCLRDNFGK
jgi:hypothetical protein